MWRNSYESYVFVAMSFEDRFDSRFKNIIQPAIEENEIGSRNLTAYRVDLSKSGESILTEISNGIAHCFLFLADVSTIDRLRFNDMPARNPNVLYEVGIALACRSPEEVLLIRDDSDPLIFDTSSVPHVTIDFEDQNRAKEEIRTLLEDRAKERKMITDARVVSSLSHLAPQDLGLLVNLSKLDPNHSIDLRQDIAGIKMLPIPIETALGNLLRLDLAVGYAITDDGSLTYRLTDIGRAVSVRFETLAGKTEEHDENNAL